MAKLSASEACDLLAFNHWQPSVHYAFIFRGLQTGMKVSGIGAPSGPVQTRKAGKVEASSPGAFARQLAETESVDEAASMEAPTAMGGIDALLVAQSVGDSLEKEARRRLIKHGEDVLDKLEEIRHGLLLGTINKDMLIGLAQMVRSRRDSVGDPRLAAVLDEIELRAEVELAKLTPR